MVLDNIRKLINPKVLIDMDAEKGILRIKESGIDAKLKKIDIVGVDVDLTIAFKLDYHIPLSPYFSRSEKNIIAIIIRVDTDILGFEQLPSTWFDKLTNRSVGERLVSLSNHVEGNVKIGTTRMNTAIIDKIK
jgi:hypothetical protein